MGSEARIPIEQQDPTLQNETTLRLVPGGRVQDIGGITLEAARRWDDYKFTIKESNLYGTPILPTNPVNRVRACVNALVEAVPERYAIEHDLIDWIPGTRPNSTVVVTKSASHLVQRSHDMLKATVVLQEETPLGQKPRKTTKEEVLTTSPILERLLYDLRLANDPVAQLIDHVDAERMDRMSTPDFKQLTRDLLLATHHNEIKERIKAVISVLKRQAQK